MKKTKKGFTLIELIAVMAIMGIVGVTINTVFSSTINLNNKIKDKLMVEQNVTSIQRSMHNDIRKANRLIIANSDTDSFNGEDMVENNQYCTTNGYIPILYLESITESRKFYAYDKIEKQVRKITILKGDDGEVTYQDILLGEFIDNISVIQNADTTDTDGRVLKGYYNVQMSSKKKDAEKKFQFRVSIVDYGGDI